MNWLAVGVGAALGAWLRWGAGLLLNGLNPLLPMGTLAVNLVGGFIMGLAFGFFNDMPQLAPQWRLFVMTGFLGGLTTFSTYSAEAMLLLQRGDYGWAFAHAALHLVGSIACCIAGLAAYRALAG